MPRCRPSHVAPFLPSMLAPFLPRGWRAVLHFVRAPSHDDIQAAADQRPTSVGHPATATRSTRRKERTAFTMAVSSLVERTVGCAGPEGP